MNKYSNGEWDALYETKEKFRREYESLRIESKKSLAEENERFEGLKADFDFFLSELQTQISITKDKDAKIAELEKQLSDLKEKSED